MGELGVRPPNILAVTFTNKAAAEMLQPRRPARAAAGGYRPWIGTFHSTSLRILRRYADRLGYTKSFAVYDTSDQLTLIRRCMRELNVNDDAFPPRSVLTRISHAKNELIGPGRVREDEPRFLRRARRGDLPPLPEAPARVRRDGLRRPDRQLRASSSSSTKTSAPSCTTASSTCSSTSTRTRTARSTCW